MTRARVLKARATDRTWRFAVADHYEIDPLEEIECDGEAQIDAARATLMSRPWNLDRPPLFRCILAHHPVGDRLILNLAHVAGDGIGMSRLVQSIQRAYAGEADPQPNVDLVVVRDLECLPAIPGPPERKLRMQPLKQYQRGALRTGPGRIAAQGGRDKSGNACVNLRLNAAEVVALLVARYLSRRSTTF